MKSLLMTIVLILSSLPCHAFFCDGGVVAEGDTQIDVLKRCGPPTFRTIPDNVTAHGALCPKCYPRYVFMWRQHVMARKWAT